VNVISDLDFLNSLGTSSHCFFLRCSLCLFPSASIVLYHGK